MPGLDAWCFVAYQTYLLIPVIKEQNWSNNFEIFYSIVHQTCSSEFKVIAITFMCLFSRLFDCDLHECKMEIKIYQ